MSCTDSMWVFYENMILSFILPPKLEKMFYKNATELPNGLFFFPSKQQTFSIFMTSLENSYVIIIDLIGILPNTVEM